MHFGSLARSASLGVLTAILATPAFAQVTPSAPTTEERTDVVVVTAQRRAEDPQDVPISLSVVGADELSKLQTSSDLEALVPNIQFENFIGFAMPRTGIRGIAQADFNGASTSTNMVYLDDVALNSGLSQGVPIWDLERAEVLRGPQGTLYGRNATGGAIRYIAAGPTANTEGYADVTLGRFNQREVRAAISGSLTDTLGIRLSYLSNVRDGDIFNVTRQDEQGEQNWYGVRGVVTWDPTEDLSFTLRAQTFESNQDLTFWKTTPGIGGVGFCADFGPTTCNTFDGVADSVADIHTAVGYQNLGYSSGYEVIESDVDPNEYIKHTPVSLNVDWDLGFATLTSVTAQVKVDQTYLLDNDASPVPFLTEYGVNNVEQITQELRLASPDDDGAFSWIGGLFYMTEDLTADLNFDATFWRGVEFWGGPTQVDSVIYRRGARQKLDTWAAFIHTAYKITPDLTLTAAARYTDEEKTMTYRFRTQHDIHPNTPWTGEQFDDFVRAVETNNYGDLLSAGDGTFTGGKTWDALTWRLALDYKLNDDTLLYGLISRGFKGGSFVPTSNFLSEVQNPDGSIVSVNPEFITDYEVGIKTDLLDGRMRFNATAFFYDYEDYQTNQLVPSLGIQVLSNLPKAEVAGVEAEVNYEPVDSLHLNLGLGYTDTEITESTDPSLIGNKLPLAEDLNVNFSARYDFNSAWGTISPEISTDYRGKYFTYKENTPGTELGGYSIYNARIGYESIDGRYYGALWANNISDEIQPILIDDPTEYWGGNLANINQRRTYGVTLGARF